MFVLEAVVLEHVEGTVGEGIQKLQKPVSCHSINRKNGENAYNPGFAAFKSARAGAPLEETRAGIGMGVNNMEDSRIELLEEWPLDELCIP